MSKHIRTLIDEIVSFNRWLSPPHEWTELVDKIVAIGEPAVPMLVDVLPGLRAEQCNNVVYVLGKIGSRQAVPALINLLDDENEEVKLWALHALGMIGDPQAISAISVALFDDNENVQIGATIALGHIDHTDAVQALITALDFGEKVRGYALASLEQLGQQSVRAMLDYVELLPDDTLKGLIMGTLTRIGTADALSAVKRYENSTM